MSDLEKDKVPCLFNKNNICPPGCELYGQAKAFYEKTLEKGSSPEKRTGNLLSNLVIVMGLRGTGESEGCEHHKQEK